MNNPGPSTKTYVTPIDIFNDRLAYAYYRLLEEDGLVARSFPDGSVKTVEDFVAIPTLFIVSHEGHLAGHVNMTDFNGRVALGHFSMLKRFHGAKGITLGLETKRQLFLLRRQDGTPLVRQLLGLTPITNPLAHRHALKMGHKKIATLKEAYKLASGEMVDAHLTLLEAPSG